MPDRNGNLIDHVTPSPRDNSAGGTVTTLPRRIPGASLHTASLPPRPPVPGPTARRPLVASFNRGAYDKAFGRLQPHGDRIGQPHAWTAFNPSGSSDWTGPAIPKIPGPRQPSDGPSAA